MKKILVLLTLVLLSMACSKSDDRMKEKAALESESSTNSALRLENDNLALKAEKMESDLTVRHNFYQAIKGIYEGDIKTKTGSFSIRITLTPSISPIPFSRVRQLEEVASDLNSLSLNVQVVQWDPKNTNSAVGCRVSGVKADIVKGELAISAESCPNLYLMKVSERAFSGTSGENIEMANRIAAQVVSGDLQSIDSLNGQVQPSTNASVYKFTALKVQE